MQRKGHFKMGQLNYGPLGWICPFGTGKKLKTSVWLVNALLVKVNRDLVSLLFKRTTLDLISLVFDNGKFWHRLSHHSLSALGFFSLIHLLSAWIPSVSRMCMCLHAESFWERLVWPKWPAPVVAYRVCEAGLSGLWLSHRAWFFMRMNYKPNCLCGNPLACGSECQGLWRWCFWRTVLSICLLLE